MPSTVKVEDFTPGRLHYRARESGQGFAHNIDRDLHLFVLWEHAQPYWDKIIDDLRSRFRLIAQYRIEWSEPHVEANFARLYGTPPQRRAADAPPSRRRAMVGGGPFMLLVVEDEDPVYVYHRTYSKKVERVNRSIVEAKTAYRTLADASLNIHSSNSIGEFFRDGTLLLGAPRMQSIVSHPPGAAIIRETLHTDLAGSDGWESLSSLFTHLKSAVDYVVLRNFDSLPDSLERGDGDVDLLCHNPQDFAAVANGFVKVDGHGKFSCETRVGGQPLPLDVRFVGDGYYDEAWQQNMLARACLQHASVPVLCAEDHFFALLYHAKLHKAAVTDKYRDRLKLLAVRLGLSQYADEDVCQDGAAVDLLGGYLSANGYRRSTPLDVFVSRNPGFERSLAAQGLVWADERRRDELLVSSLMSRTPMLWRLRKHWLTQFVSLYRLLKRRLQGA